MKGQPSPHGPTDRFVDLSGSVEDEDASGDGCAPQCAMRSEPCACGQTIVARDLGPFIRLALTAHYMTLEHAQWSNRQPR